MNINKTISKTNRTVKNRNFFVIMDESLSHYKHLEVISKTYPNQQQKLTHTHARKEQKIPMCQINGNQGRVES